MSLHSVLVALLGGVCEWCGAKHNVQIDHIKPVREGGKNIISNLRLLCGDCHKERHGRKTDELGEVDHMPGDRVKLLEGKTPKDLGIKKSFRKRPFFYATCEHANKKGKPDCRKKFTGWTLNLVMGNKAIHESWHEKQDRKLAELAAVN